MDEYLKNKIQGTSLEDHDIWHKYQNQEIHIEKYLTFWRGSGGNFLSQYLHDRVSSNPINEHGEWRIESSGGWLYPGQLDLWFLENGLTCRALLSQVSNIQDIISHAREKTENRSSWVAGIAHVFPYILSHIYNLKIDKLMYIDVGELYEYTGILDIIKNEFGYLFGGKFARDPVMRMVFLINRAYKNMPFYIYADMPEVINLNDFDEIKSFSKDAFQCIDLYSSFNFYFLMDDSMDNTLEDYIRFGKHALSQTAFKDARSVPAHWEYMKNKFNNIHTYDYYDIFFKLDTSGFNIKDEDLKTIIKYNEINFDSIRAIKLFLRDEVMDTLSTLEKINNNNKLNV